MNRTYKDYRVRRLKGRGRGTADVVPGVSGGTIAFIVGIYEELINSIKSINISSLKLLFQFKIKDFWAPHLWWRLEHGHLRTGRNEAICLNTDWMLRKKKSQTQPVTALPQWNAVFLANRGFKEGVAAHPCWKKQDRPACSILDHLAWSSIHPKHNISWLCWWTATLV